MGRVRRRLPRRDVLPSLRLAAGDRGGLPPSHAFPLRAAGRAHRGRVAAGARQEPPVRRRAGVAAVRGLRRSGRRHGRRRRRRSRTRRRRWRERLGVDHLELRNVAARHPDWPTQDLYVTFRKEILPDAEANLLAIPRKQRAMVRKGIKNGAARARSTPRRTASSRSTPTTSTGTARPPLPRRYFEALQRVFGADCEVLTVVDPGGTAGEQRAELLLPRRGAALLCRRRRRRPAISPPTISSTGN